jgi:hypothetical protein
MATQIKLRRDTDGDWVSANTVLAEAEVGLVIDGDEKIIGAKVGDGATAWIALPFHLPVLAGAANALESLGGSSATGVPLAQTTTFLLKGLSGQTSKVLGIQEHTGTALEFSVDKDGNVIAAGTLGVTGATTLTGGVVGPLNILTGALQIAGNTSMQIMQIVEAVYEGGTHTHSNQNYTRAQGSRITIVPKHTDSKIILIANWRIDVENDTTNQDSCGSKGGVNLNCTASAGSTANGTVLAKCATYEYFQSEGASGGFGEGKRKIRTKHSIFSMFEADHNSLGGTASRTYDLTSLPIGNYDLVYMYPSEDYTQFYAIEIL